MGYSIWLDMDITDYAVLAAIKNLYATQETITRDDIAAEIGCSPRTVTRALSSMMENDVITVQRIPKTRRYRYIINEVDV